MRSIEIALNSWNERIQLVFIGDLHLGNSSVRENLIAETAKRLEAPNTFWIDLGDSIDAVNMRDPRFDPLSLPDWIKLSDLADIPRAQIERYKHYFENLGSTCLARLYGNHEATLQKHSERNVYSELNKVINLPPERALGYSGFVRLRFRKRGRKGRIENVWTQTIYISHGTGGGKLAGSKVTNLERLPMAFDADIYAVGHTHTKLVLQKRLLGLSSKTTEIIDKKLIMLNVGSFMDGKTGYPERAGLYPQALGPVEVHFFPKSREVRIIQ